MSNLSNIGFPISNDDELIEMIKSVYGRCQFLDTKDGKYAVFTDPSGASLFIQFSNQANLIGFNPHFFGKSRRRVGLMHDVERPDSPLDGAFYGWANPSDEANPEGTGDYPFVFDLPDRATLGKITLPQIVEIQLTAFPEQLSVYKDEADFDALGPAEEPKFAPESFVPTGLFISEDAPPGTPAQPYGIFHGIVLEATEHRNAFTNVPFSSMLIHTLGGEIDIVADKELLPNLPEAGAIIGGSFYLSGRVLNDIEQLDHPAMTNKHQKKKKRFGLF